MHVNFCINYPHIHTSVTTYDNILIIRTFILKNAFWRSRCLLLERFTYFLLRIYKYATMYKISTPHIVFSLPSLTTLCISCLISFSSIIFHFCLKVCLASTSRITYRYSLKNYLVTDSPFSSILIMSFFIFSYSFPTFLFYMLSRDHILRLLHFQNHNMFLKIG